MTLVVSHFSPSKFTRGFVGHQLTATPETAAAAEASVRADVIVSLRTADAIGGFSHVDLWLIPELQS